MPKYLAPSERSLPREFVRSPYFPSAPEAAVILESIREAQLEIDVLSQNISDLQEAIKPLEAQRARAETYTRFQQSLLAPIRKLPSEVLAEIFLYCIPRIVIEGAVKNRPMQLAGVSGYWRHIIQNLQVFWSSFDVNLTQMADHPMGRAISAVGVAVTRSGVSPLRFHLVAPSHDAAPAAIWIISVLYPHRQRWQCVSLSLSFPHILQRTPLVRQEFPALRSLRMHSHTRLINVIDAFELAPQLTQLYRGGLGLNRS
jgi:hypothetical protein